MESILTSVKKMLGITKEYEHFDPDLIIHINSVFMILNQIGVGPAEVFTIEDDTANWSDFTENKSYESVKTYMCLKVKLLFDPPVSNSVLEAYNRAISELESRLNIEYEMEATKDELLPND